MNSADNRSSRSGPRPEKGERKPGNRKPHSKYGSGESAGLSRGLMDFATEALNELLDFAHPADAVLSRYFRENRSLGPRERTFVAETCYTVLRRRRSLERLCEGKPTPSRLLIAALVKYQGYAKRQLETTLKSTDLEWALQLKSREEGEALSLGEQTDLPDWLVEKLVALMGEEQTLRLARGMNASAPLDLRVNLLKGSREEVLGQILKSGLEAEPCPYAPQGIRLKGKPSLAKHPLFLNGVFEVQDEGSQLLGHLLAPKRGEMVVDFCAGAGGKTLLLGSLMRSTGRLYAFDVSDHRLAKLKPRAARSGLSNIHPAVIASEGDQRIKRLAGKIDRVLVDAPCSGLGTLRRNPDLKWRQGPEGIAELTVKQAAILASAARLVKNGGRLVYATCSVLPEENEAIVDAFLAVHPDFQRISAAEVLAKQGIALDTGVDLRLRPDLHGTDGFYAAVLERHSA